MLMMNFQKVPFANEYIFSKKFYEKEVTFKYKEKIMKSVLMHHYAFRILKDLVSFFSCLKMFVLAVL